MEEGERERVKRWGRGVKGDQQGEGRTRKGSEEEEEETERGGG